MLSFLKESHPFQISEFIFVILLMNQHSTGWWALSSRRETWLSLWLNSKVIDTTSMPTSPGLKFPRLWRKLTPSIRPLVLPFDVMQSKRRWQMHLLHLGFLQIMSYCCQIISLYDVIWSLHQDRWLLMQSLAYCHRPCNKGSCQHCFPRDVTDYPACSRAQ